MFTKSENKVRSKSNLTLVPSAHSTMHEDMTLEMAAVAYVR